MVDVHQLHFRNKSPLVPRRSPDFEVRDGCLYTGSVVNSNKDSPVLFMNVALEVVLLRSMSSSDGASRTLRQGRGRNDGAKSGTGWSFSGWLSGGRERRSRMGRRWFRYRWGRIVYVEGVGVTVENIQELQCRGSNVELRWGCVWKQVIGAQLYLALCNRLLNPIDDCNCGSSFQGLTVWAL